MSRMKTLIAIATAAMIAGGAFFAGWSLREQRAIEACRAIGGQWSDVTGYCYGHPYGEAQE